MSAYYFEALSVCFIKLCLFLTYLYIIISVYCDLQNARISQPPGAYNLKFETTDTEVELYRGEMYSFHTSMGLVFSRSQAKGFIEKVVIGRGGITEIFWELGLCKR